MKTKVPQQFTSMPDRLMKLGTFYNKEARRCAKGKAYLAASAMEMAAIEALLQSMCFLYSDSVRKTAVFQKKNFRGKRNKALEFSLKQLIDIAEELSWLPEKQVTWAGKRTTVAGFLHEARELRNFMHPGKWARLKPNSMKFNKAVYGVVCEIFDVAISWLQHHVHKSLERTMRREGLVTQ